MNVVGTTNSMNVVVGTTNSIPMNVVGANQGLVPIVWSVGPATFVGYRGAISDGRRPPDTAIEIETRMTTPGKEVGMKELPPKDGAKDSVQLTEKQQRRKAVLSDTAHCNVALHVK